MKAKRHKKIIGIALGDRSLLVAEVAAGTRPQIRRLAEMIYPPGASILAADELGAALRKFLGDNNFSGAPAVVGIPAKWLVIKNKEMPPADDATLASMLRMGVETEFPSDLKDLAYDFKRETADKSSGVMLLGTPQKNVEASVAICKAAGLTAIAVTPSALSLAQVAGKAMDKNVLVLSVAASGSELSVHETAGGSSIRHLRGPNPQPPFISELRRAVSTLSGSGQARQIVLWDSTGLDAAALGEQMGMTVNAGELSSLGVDDSIAGTNGDGSKFATAVALALTALEGEIAVDFLHSRLAPPKQRRVSHSVIAAAIAVVLILAGGVTAYQYLQRQETALARSKATLDAGKDEIGKAEKFVKTVSFAQYWHGGDPLYLACLRDVTNAMPEDGQTFATSMEVRAEVPHVAAAGATAKIDSPHTLNVTLIGKTSNAENVTAFERQLRRNSDRFTNITVQQEMVSGQQREESFTITFTYVPAKPAAPARKTVTPAH